MKTYIRYMIRYDTFGMYMELKNFSNEENYISSKICKIILKTHVEENRIYVFLSTEF